MSTGKRKFRATPSHIYQRLLRGEVTSERYVAVIKRAAEMRMRVGKFDHHLVRSFEREHKRTGRWWEQKP